jgi:hypothetical protein
MVPVRATGAGFVMDLAIIEAKSPRRLCLQGKWEDGMAVGSWTSEEIVRRGQEIYEQEIRPKVEAGDDGKLLVINVETGDTGDYVMDADDAAALERAKATYPDAELFAVRVGSPSAYRLGGRFGVLQP